MKKLIINQPFSLAAGTLMVLPTLYFIISGFLNYSLGFPVLWSVIQPIFENPGNKNLGWNINLLLLFGPLIAILLNLPQVVRIMLSDPLHVDLHLQFKKHGWSWLIILAGAFCLGCLFVYLLGENCR